GSQITGDGVHITTIYMPLVRTPMIAPTKMYDRFPAMSPEDAGALITEAIRKRPKRVSMALGNLGQLSYTVAPGAQDLVLNRAVKLFSDSAAAKGDQTAEQKAFVRPTRRVHR